MNKTLVDLADAAWAMCPKSLNAFFDEISQLNITAELLQIEIEASAESLQVSKGVATVPITGILMRSVPSWMRFFRITATGYDTITAQIGEALADADVKSIHLAVNSPGGMVAGVAMAADAIYEARNRKEVTATITDLGASGAYWLAGQASQITAADPNTQVGSIGVYSVYYDWSKAFDQAGIKPVVIRSGPHKAMGIDEITDDQVMAVQEMVDGMASNFMDAVAQGRSVDRAQIEELATGQLWISTEAMNLGLIDAVVDKRKRSPRGDTNAKGVKPMDNEKEIESAQSEARETAQAEERERARALQAKFPEHPEFAVKAITEGWDLKTAGDEFCKVLQAENAELAKANEAQKPAEGEAPIPDGGSGGGDAGGSGDFMTDARAMARAESTSVTQAMKKLVRKDPDLYQRHLDSCAAKPRHYIGQN